MERINTLRLEIFPLTAAQLQDYLTNSEKLEAELGYSISRNVLDENAQRAIGIKLKRMAEVDPLKHVWFTYWLIKIKDIDFGAGLAGFKGYPDQNGFVEIGYGIDHEHWNKGYMTEAAGALVTWALAQPVCKTVTAIETKNPASIGVLKKLGFTLVHEDKKGTTWHRS